MPSPVARARLSLVASFLPRLSLCRIAWIAGSDQFGGLGMIVVVRLPGAMHTSFS